MIVSSQFIVQYDLVIIFLQANLKCINSWDFDVFAFRRMTKGE